MAQRRMERIASQILQVTSRVLLSEVKDPRVGMVTLTRVRVSPDLQVARVYFSTLGGPEDHTRTLAGLRSATPYIRTALGRALRLRYTPDLRFEFDPTMEEAERIETLLRRDTSDES